LRPGADIGEMAQRYSVTAAETGKTKVRAQALTDLIEKPGQDGHRMAYKLE